MTTAEKPDVWWTYDHVPTRWAIVGSLVIAWLLGGRDEARINRMRETLVRHGGGLENRLSAALIR